jgi:biotin carboxylase
MWITGNLRKDFWGRYPNLIILGGGVLQQQTLVECDRMGLGKVLVDGNPLCWCAKSPWFNSDYFVHSGDFKEPWKVLSQIKKFLRKHPKIKPVGVYTQGCDMAYAVAYVARGLGLPNIGVDVAFRTNNKIEMRKAFDKFGILQPDWDINESKLPLPLVYKAVDNCASRGLTIVREERQKSGAGEKAKAFSHDKRVLIEEFIDGEEYSVDTIVYKGRVYPAGISDRVFETKEKFAIQNGSITPSALPEETQQRMYWVMQDCADALGVKWGAFKGDLIVRDGKIYVLEITARLSGGFDSQFRKPYSYGVNLIKATIDLACGKPLDFEDIIPKWFKYSQTFTVFPKPGVIKDIVGLEETQSIPGIRNVFITKTIGDKVEYSNCADRVVHMVASADTQEELEKIIAQARKTLQFITE